FGDAPGSVGEGPQSAPWGRGAVRGGQRGSGAGSVRGALVGGMAPPHDPVAAGGGGPGTREGPAGGGKYRRRPGRNYESGSPACCSRGRRVRRTLLSRSVGCCGGTKKHGSTTGMRRRVASRRHGDSRTDKRVTVQLSRSSSAIRSSRNMAGLCRFSHWML